MPTKKQIFGHSHVSHLKSYIRDTPTRQFDLNFREPKLVQYSGYSGATVPTLRQHLDAITDFEPEIVVLLIGTNDLYYPDRSPEGVACAVMDLVDTLLYRCGAKYVILFQTFHRTTATRPSRFPVDLEWFNDRVDIFNRLLTSAIPASFAGKACFWRCNGFWSDDAKGLLWGWCAPLKPWAGEAVCKHQGIPRVSYQHSLSLNTGKCFTNLYFTFFGSPYQQ